MKDIIVVAGPGHYGSPFKRLGNVTHKLKKLVAHPDKVKLLVLTGGEDLHPSLYHGEDQLECCFTNVKRDVLERNIFEFCRKYDIKITGICRGFQFLNVMAGGFMYQHLERHELFRMHDCYFPHINRIMRVTSTHHQLVELPSGSIPVAWAYPRRSDFYVGSNGDFVDPEEEPDYEIEAAIFPNINAMGVQYHPEVTLPKYDSRKHYEIMTKDFVEMGMKEFVEKYSGRTDYVRERPRKSRGKVRRASRS